MAAGFSVAPYESWSKQRYALSSCADVAQAMEARIALDRSRAGANHRRSGKMCIVIGEIEHLPRLSIPNEQRSCRSKAVKSDHMTWLDGFQYHYPMGVSLWSPIPPYGSSCVRFKLI
jgi:hypothetical protein